MYEPLVKTLKNYSYLYDNLKDRYMVKNKTKKVSNVIKQVVDQETGELIDQTIEKHFVTKVDTDDFFMVFIENLAPFFGLKHPSDVRLITAMCTLAEFNTGIVKMSKKTRATLCEMSNISPTNISRSISRLVKMNLLVEDEGDYTINPNIFWKGSTATRAEVLKNGGLTFQIQLVDSSAK